jgi:hypothetical protein
VRGLQIGCEDQKLSIEPASGRNSSTIQGGIEGANLDDEEIQNVVRPRVAAGARPKKHDPMRRADRENARHDLTEQIGRQRRNGPNSSAW